MINWKPIFLQREFYSEEILLKRLKKNVLKSELSRGSQQLVSETQKEIEQ